MESRVDIEAVDEDAALIRLDEPGYHVKDGCLAGAVRAEKAHRFAALQVDADALDDRALLEGFLDPLDNQPLFRIQAFARLQMRLHDGLNERTPLTLLLRSRLRLTPIDNNHGNSFHPF